LFTVGWLTGRASPRTVLQEVSWPVLVFVVGMLLVVRGFERGWLDHLAVNPPHDTRWALVAGAMGTAVGSNIVNNVPMALLAIPMIERASGPTRQALAFGVLAGANIGPTLTTYGSLATMLWLALIRKRGLDVSTRAYVRVGVITMPLVLLAALLALWGTTS
jgi:arsenical pump membrane protein